MAAQIKLTELTLHEPVRIPFSFSGIREKHAQAIMRDIVRERWPKQARPKQCVYVIRLVGDVAVAYKHGFSPVTYIGEGSASTRLYDHTTWLVPLVIAVPQLTIEICVAEVVRKNQPRLYKFVEADLLLWFAEIYGAVPWFNRQREKSKEGQYEYQSAARKKLFNAIAVRAGAKYRWAIQPTKNNLQYESFAKGIQEDA